MKPKTFMLIAGEPSGDLLAAELVTALRERLPSAHRRNQSPPQFFGAGGAKMAAAGVELALDLTQHSVIGVTDVLKNILKFRRLFQQLLALALERKPDVVIGVDYGGFNLRFAHAVKNHVRENPFSEWNPKLVQFVSPQVWASRPGRARRLAADYDLLLSIFPFEKEWYAKRVPQLRVDFVGHPMIGRFTSDELLSKHRKPKTGGSREVEAQPQAGFRRPGIKYGAAPSPAGSAESRILLLPGSRRSELQRHLPVMLAALKLIQAQLPFVKAKLVLPNPLLLPLAKSLAAPAQVEIQIGELPWALAEAEAAMASTGTVTMECACFGVPTVTLYKTSWLTYQIARRIVTVKSLTMPNLLAGETVYPEFIQRDATPENLACATLELLQDESRRAEIGTRLEKIIASLGEPGAAGRAAEAVFSLFV